MINSDIAIPIWLFVIFTLSFLYTCLFAISLPSLKWYLRRGTAKAIDKKNAELQVKIRPFVRTKRQVLIERLCNDPKVLEAIESSVENGELKRRQAEAKVKTYAKEIMPYFNALIYFKLGYWAAKTLTRFLYRVKIGAADSKLLDDVDPEATVVFVMNHRSNVDYLLVSYLVADKAALSYAVGEWAQVFPLKQLIKSLGAFFVRRNSNDPLYRRILERYVHMTTAEGVCQAVYLEGGLSRDGSLMPAKLGFLDYMLRDYNKDSDRDIVFVPIAINYDRVLEDQNMVKWSVPEGHKTMRQYITKLVRFIKENIYIGARLRWKKFGYASVNFGIPLSAKQFSESAGIHFNQLSTESRFIQTQVLADEIMASIKHVMPVLPIPLLCSAFVHSPEEKLRSLEIFSKVESLIRIMIDNGAAMKKREQPRNRTLMDGLNLLVSRGILEEKNDHYYVSENSNLIIEYYANSIKHWFENTPKPNKKSISPTTSEAV